MRLIFMRKEIAECTIVPINRTVISDPPCIALLKGLQRDHRNTEANSGDYPMMTVSDCNII